MVSAILVYKKCGNSEEATKFTREECAKEDFAEVAFELDLRGSSRFLEAERRKIKKQHE